MKIEQIQAAASDPLLVWAEPSIDNEAVCKKIVENTQLVWKEYIITGDPVCYLNGMFFGSIFEMEYGEHKGEYEVCIWKTHLAFVETIEEGKAILEGKKVGWMRAVILNALEK